MPSTLNAPVLQVDANIIHQVDTSNPQNLFSLWCMISRCADVLPQGRRLENLVWRLLMEEVPSHPTIHATAALPREIQPCSRKISPEDVPRLSASVDSLENDEAVDLSSGSSPLDISRPRIRRQDSCTSTRNRHISSENLEKMVSSIVEQKESLSSPLPDIPPLQVPPKHEGRMMLPPPELIRSGSTSTESPGKDSDNHSLCSSPASPGQANTKTTTVVRGFSPSYRAVPAVFTAPKTTPEVPAPTSSPVAKAVEPKKPRAKFLLGGSSEGSYSDHAHSVDRRPAFAPSLPKNKIFQIGGSSEEESSLKSALASPHHGFDVRKKQTSFANHLTTTIPSTSAVIDEDEDDYYDESAIDDDDEDWEDSVEEESGRNSVDEKTFFQRVDSSANLTSRRSLITLGLESNKRQSYTSHPGNMSSQSTTATAHRTRNNYNGPCIVASPNDSDDAPLTMKRGPSRVGQIRSANEHTANEMSRPSGRPIVSTNGGASQPVSFQPVAFSPRTTRRHMMSTELTESLRRHLLWERSQKTSTANAVMRRRHTSQDVANLRQFPQESHMSRANNDINASSWNQDFTREAFGGYHTKGW